MFSRRAFVFAIIAAGVCAFLLTPSTFGCNPPETDMCESSADRGKFTPAIEASSLTRPLAANRAGMKRNLLEFAGRTTTTGSEPQTENPTIVSTVVPQDTQIYIPARKTVWFEVTDEIKRLTVSMNTYRQTGLSLYIYSPEQHDVQRAEEIGRGTSKNGFDLWWSGSVRENGNWFMRLRNDNDFAVPYNLVTRTATDSGQEYRPNVSYAFGTGETVTTAAAGKTKPVAPPAAVPPAAHMPAPIPGSPDPFTAPMPSGAQTYIEPHSTVWYKASDRKRRLNIWMDADPNLGLTMQVYGPDIQDVWHAKPTGIGAPANGFKYFWTGRAKFKGDWLIRITNPNDFSVPYTLTSASISDKSGDLCRDCHGGIGDDQFERCEHEGSFCEDLKDELAS